MKTNFFLFSKMEDGNMSLKWGEKKEVEKNVRNFLTKFKIIVRKRAHIKPEHGNRILYVNENNINAIMSKGIKHDGLITTCNNITLTLASADCCPVALTNKKGNFVSLLHVGREGAKIKIVAKAIDIVTRRFLVNSGEILLTIGPGIKKCCYGTDIVKLIKQQARSRGIPYRNISAADVCTCCGKDEKDGKYLFFSHCRSRSVKEQETEGRFITVVSL